MRRFPFGYFGGRPRVGLQRVPSFGLLLRHRALKDGSTIICAVVKFTFGDDVGILRGLS